MQEFKPFKEGKVREVYDIGENLILVATDRISAFDHILKNKITDKGAILTQMSKFWFDYTKDIVKNHMVSVDVKDMPEFFQSEKYDGNSMLCKKLEMLPIECIVRGYITGSGWESYKKNGTVCGISLPEGLKESEKLPEPIYTPSTKAELGDHDENISFEQSVEVLEKLYPGKGRDYATQIKDCTIKLYKKCAEYALSKGIIIADTKFEFGLDENGNVVIGDEMLTPDSSRFWPLEGYEAGKSQPSYDKQFVRDWLKANPDSDYLLPDDVIDKTIAKYKEQHVIQQEISNALADDRVEVFFQPIYSNRDKCFTSAEALVRIRKKDGTLLSPSIFIPVAEKTGIILELGERVIEKVCLLLKNSDAIKLGIHYIEINLSVIQCEKRDLAKRLISIVEKYDIAPGLINLEITETASISARTILLENMKTLINYGFTFSLDDFGKGESNLMYIVEMPVSIVKLDYDMLKAFFRSPKAKTVVQAVVNMAHNMNLKMVAEGIETEEEIQGMSKENIDYIQGYYYSCPVPQNDFLEFLRNNQPVLSSSAE